MRQTSCGQSSRRSPYSRMSTSSGARLQMAARRAPETLLEGLDHREQRTRGQLGPPQTDQR